MICSLTKLCMTTAPLRYEELKRSIIMTLINCISKEISIRTYRTRSQIVDSIFLENNRLKEMFKTKRLKHADATRTHDNTRLLSLSHTEVENANVAFKMFEISLMFLITTFPTTSKTTFTVSAELVELDEMVLPLPYSQLRVSPAIFSSLKRD